MKTCKGCGTDKPLDDFYRVRDGRPNGRQARCKPCFSKQSNKPEAVRANRLRRVYGLTVEAANALLANGCAVCGSMERLVIDHNHATGDVRAALCNHCNLALGHAGDDPARLRSLALYLEAHS